MKKITFILIALMLTGSIQATIVNIPADYPTIQQGIGAAGPGDTVLVYPGSYIEEINFIGKSITVASLYLTTQDTSYISQTIIDGDSTFIVVTFDGNEDSTSVLCGFTITNGLGYYVFPGNFGYGGITCSGASPKLDNLVVTGNYMGGVYCTNGSDPTLTDVTISGNEGNGMGCSVSSPDISEVIVSDNQGHGIYCSPGSNPTLTDVLITGNITNGYGGGMYIFDCSPVLENVTITNNTAQKGGGLSMGNFDPSPTFKNVTIAYNSAFSCGGGIYFWGTASPVFDPVDRCNIYLNTAPIGNDLRIESGPNQMIVVDTFTVMNPTGFYASPLSSFTFDILNGKVAQADADLYVSPNGDNNNSGLTEEEPLKTIWHAQSIILVDELNPHTIHLLEGTYSRSSNEEVFPIYLTDFIHLKGVSANSVILDAEDEGGVMIFDATDQNQISHLSAVNGAGTGIVCQNGGSPSIENVIISGNQSGGVWVSQSHPKLKNVLITGNSASKGGGIRCDQSGTPLLYNVTISDNLSTSGYGGGIYMQYKSTTSMLINTIVWNNQPDQIYITGESSIFIKWSDVQGGEAGITTSSGAIVHWLEGNIDEDPLFAGTGEHPFSLSSGSPCVDAGIPDVSGLNLPPGDLAGDIRVWDGDGDGVSIVDMGAYEFGSFPVGIDRLEVRGSRFEVNCFPNPADGITNIQYLTSNISHVILTVLDVYGKEIVSLVNEQQSAGEHIVQFDATDLPAGIYFVKLQAGNEVVTRKAGKL